MILKNVFDPVQLGVAVRVVGLPSSLGPLERETALPTRTWRSRSRPICATCPEIATARSNRHGPGRATSPARVDHAIISLYAESLTTGRAAASFGGFFLDTDESTTGSTVQVTHDRLAEVGATNTFTVGSEWLEGETDARGTATSPAALGVVDPQNLTSDNTAERRTTALFVQDTWRPSPAWSLMLGLRGDREREDCGVPPPNSPPAHPPPSGRDRRARSGSDKGTGLPDRGRFQGSGSIYGSFGRGCAAQFTPSISGMLISISTTSGFRVSYNSKASSPLLATAD